MYNYEERDTAFIDILGFSNLIKSSEVDQTILPKVIESLNEMLLIKNMAQIDEKTRVSLFSDNILISYPKDEHEYSLRSLIWDCMYLQIKLMTKGIFVRGGITSGLLYHDNNFVVGPALVRAYNIESKYAIYPRIVVDENVRKRSDKFAVDNDGMSFVDIFKNTGYWGTAFEYVGGFEKVIDIISEQIHEKLDNEKDFGIRSKYAWLGNYLMRSLK